MDIIEKVKVYYEREYNNLLNGLKNYNWMKSEPDKYIQQTASKFCTIVMFVQDLGIAFNDVIPIYENYCEKFRDLLLTYKK
jgi:hypothetical protein